MALACLCHCLELRTTIVAKYRLIIPERLFPNSKRPLCWWGRRRHVLFPFGRQAYDGQLYAAPTRGDFFRFKSFFRGRQPLLSCFRPMTPKGSLFLDQGTTIIYGCVPVARHMVGPMAAGTAHIPSSYGGKEGGY